MVGLGRWGRGVSGAGRGCERQVSAPSTPFRPQLLPRVPPGCAFPYAAYSMPASWLHSRLHQLFVPTAALNSFLCTVLSCYSRWVRVLGQP